MICGNGSVFEKKRREIFLKYPQLKLHHIKKGEGLNTQRNPLLLTPPTSCVYHKNVMAINYLKNVCVSIFTGLSKKVKYINEKKKI